MPIASSTSGVRDLERAFLKKGWWLFPLGGVLAVLAVGGPFWAWVDGQSIVWPGGGRLMWRVLIGALIGGSIPAVWALGWRVRTKRGRVVLAVGLVVVAAEGLLLQPTIQAALWLATRARLEADQSFMREVCYVRLEENVGRSDERPAIILVGSSQVLNGVDAGLLRELVYPVPVIRRAMFGMTPLKTLAMQAYMPFRAGDTCVQYLSEFDFTNQEAFPFAWLRPYGSWRTAPEVLRCLSWRVKVRHWREVIDYLMAATTEWWRARDALNRIVFRFCVTEREQDAGYEGGRPFDPAMAAEQARGDLKFEAAEWAAFQRLARRLEVQQVAMLVFEGDVNPAIYSDQRRRVKQTVRERLEECLAAGAGRYVSREEQALDLEASDWRDMTHLGRSGREKMTRRIAQELSASVMPID